MHSTCLYDDHRMYYDRSTCIYYDHNICMYYDHNTCMVHACTMTILHACTMIGVSSCTRFVGGDHTCIYYDHSTCMYYDHSTCMSYDHSERSSKQSSDRAIERAFDRSSDRVTERASDRVSERGSMPVRWPTYTMYYDRSSITKVLSWYCLVISGVLCVPTCIHNFVWYHVQPYLTGPCYFVEPNVRLALFDTVWFQNVCWIELRLGSVLDVLVLQTSYRIP